MPGHRAAGFEDAQHFVTALQPLVEEAVGDVQIPVLGVLSQAALETGWGQRIISRADGVSSHNLFGMKSVTRGDPSVGIATQEYVASGWTQEVAQFRSYPDWSASIEHYVEQLKNSERYADVINTGNDIRAFAENLLQAGYATDPGYADKIVSVYERVKELVNR